MRKLVKFSLSLCAINVCAVSFASDYLATYDCAGEVLKIHFHDDWAEADWSGNSYELHKAVSVDDVVYLGEELTIREDASHMELELTNQQPILCTKKVTVSG